MNPVFDDIRKWKVSVGVGLIISIGVVWWAFLGLNDALYIEIKSIKLLTETAQEEIYLRQWLLQSFLPWILGIYSAFALCLGVLWIKRELPKWQLELDRRERMDQLKLDGMEEERRLSAATHEEVDRKIDAEIREQGDDISGKEREEQSESVRDTYIQVHEEVTKLIIDNLPNRWALYKDVRVGTVYLDAVLRSIDGKMDYLIEIIYIRKGYRKHFMMTLMQKLMQTKIMYTMETKKYSSVMILVVYEADVSLNNQNIMKIANSVAIDSVRKTSSYIYVEMIDRSRLDVESIAKVLREHAIR